MSFKFFSPNIHDRKHVDQWDGRSLSEELESYKNRILAKVFDKFLTKSGLEIIEAGCGLGGWVKYFDQKGHDIVGVELYTDLIDKVKKVDPGINIIKGDILDLDFPDNFFDVYISLGVIEHFENGPGQALTEAARVLKPGSIAFISVPFLNQFRKFLVHPLRQIYFLFASMTGRRKYFWEYRYTRKEMVSFLENAGFKILHVGIDDYEKNDPDNHIGLASDFFFLKKKGGKAFELNGFGRFILKIARCFSPWIYCSSILIVAEPDPRPLSSDTIS